MNKIEHVVWDWNGTLVDDAQLCVDIVNGILSDLSIPTVSIEFYRDNFTFPVSSYYEKIGLPTEGDSFRVISEKFISEYRMRRDSRQLQEHARAVMNKLAESGIGQSVLSAGKLSDLATFVDELGLSGFLHPITGVSNIHAAGKKDISKTHLAKITHDPSNVLLVGDTVHDEEVSVHLGTQCLLFTGGHNSVKALGDCRSELIDDLRLVLLRVID